MLSICRTLFFIVILFCAIFLGSQYNNIHISTDLKDLSPTLSEQPLIQKAIDTLSSDIESRFMIIVHGKTQEDVNAAAEKLENELRKIDFLSVGTNDTSQLLEEFKQYRFQLLSPKQQKKLKESEHEQLINNALRNLYRMDSSLQLLPFNEDPLSTFDNYVNHLLQNGFTINNGVQVTVLNGDRTYYSTLSIKISQGAMQIDKQHELIDKINLLEASLKKAFPVELLRSGVFFFAADAAEKSEKDIKLISTVSTFAIILLLLFVFRSVSILLLPVTSIGLGVIFAAGVNHYLYGSIHILTIVFGASLIGIIIDYSLHYFYHQNPNTHSSKDDRVSSTLFRAMLLSLITSLVGYGALSFSSLDALKKVALFSCCGILAAWLSVITIGSLSKIVEIKINDQIFSKGLTYINQFFSKAIQKFSFIAWGILITASACTIYLYGIPTSDNPHLFFNPAKELLNQEQKANLLSKSFEPGRYIVITGNSVEQVYEHYEKMLNTITNDLPKEHKNPFFSAMHFLPSPKQQKQNYQLQEKIYQPGGIAEIAFDKTGIPPEQAEKLYQKFIEKKGQVIEPASVFSKNSALPPVWAEQNEEHLGFVLIEKNSDVNKIENIILDRTQELEGVVFINTLSLSQEALKEQRKSASVLLFLAYAFIALIMLLYYRSVSALWILLVPITATLGTLITFTVLGIDITLFNVMGLFLVLGLGMDYVIFIKEMYTDSDNVKNNVTQNAILLSTITTLLSFGLLSLSSIPVAQAFGSTLLIGNTLNFLCTLIFAQLLSRRHVNAHA